MLSKLRCPHTGLVNFFTDVDPFISVGSIIATGPSRYVWRCHLVDHRCGVTTDPMSAEANLRRALEMPGSSLSRTYARREFIRGKQQALLKTRRPAGRARHHAG
jgi:hypothetical protein